MLQRERERGDGRSISLASGVDIVMFVSAVIFSGMHLDHNPKLPLPL